MKRYRYYVDRDRQPIRCAEDDRLGLTELLMPDGTWSRYQVDPSSYSPIDRSLAEQFAREWVNPGAAVDMEAAVSNG